MDSEVDADLKTLVLPANTTISTTGASLSRGQGQYLSRRPAPGAKPGGPGLSAEEAGKGVANESTAYMAGNDSRVIPPKNQGAQK